MNRKRTNLDTSEAEFLYAHSLVEFNKHKKFQELSIPERNNLVDEACLKVIRKSCKDYQHIEAITQEIFAYKLSKEEESKFYNSDIYTSGLEKPENYKELLKARYDKEITKTVSRLINQY